MTDRELLEAAARAAGDIPVPLVWIRPFDDELTPINNRGEPWNPLSDDGDALRLAVKLGLLADTGLTSQFMESKDCAATRRAIVCAAAAIGTHKEGAQP